MPIGVTQTRLNHQQCGYFAHTSELKTHTIIVSCGCVKTQYGRFCAVKIPANCNYMIFHAKK